MDHRDKPGGDAKLLAVIRNFGDKPVSRTDAILKRLSGLHPKLIDLSLDRMLDAHLAVYQAAVESCA